MSRRYDAADYLRDFERTGTYPRIHDQVWAAVLEDVPKDHVIVDLGSSTGLLTARLHGSGYQVVAFEGDIDAVDAGLAAGTYEGVAVVDLQIAPMTLGTFDDMLGQLLTGRPAAVVARRVFPELHTALGADYEDLPRILARHAALIVSETRIESAKTRHPLGTAAAEHASLSPWYGTRPTTRVAVHTHDRLHIP